MNNNDEGFVFKLSENPSEGYSDAEALFRDLKDRDPGIPYLWSHQADILRTYHNDIHHQDIALELPTGTGKTLVGLLIAEWRRLTLGERAVYLCPTRQLAYQVGAKASEYGIPSCVLVGPQDQYSQEEFTAYNSASTIAVTTYSSLFNTRPRINDPETIILDDAHAGENYISDMWSLSVSRANNRDLYDQIVGLYAAELPSYIVPDFLNDDASPHQKSNLDLLPAPKFTSRSRALTNLIDSYANRENKLIFPWQMIRGRLAACCAFFSWSEILIRPSIPPTLTHQPFAGARQRVYMSATLGAGGELERITGIPEIHRIPAPRGWDRQSTGRRLFIFPDRSFTAEEYSPWLAEHVGSNERSLVLTPHRFALNSFIEILSECDVEHEILSSLDVEASLDAFTSKTNAILALTNRYDGIDLPGETCRSLVVFGLPAAVNLHERFLWSKLGLTSVLRDRIRTRITQAVGRCTRNPTDYAVVVMVGEDLIDFCIKRENRTDMHPELRAEMEFGLDNSESNEIDKLTTLANLFLGREDEWSIAEEDIAKRRNELVKSTQTYVDVLRSIVSTEVQYHYDLWREDYTAALEKATSIVDQLSGEELSGYRALWNYFAGCAAYFLGQSTSRDELVRTAAERFDLASQSSRAILWFAKLSQELNPQKEEELRESVLNAIGVDSMNRYLTRLGTSGAKFDRIISEHRALINETDADKFDRALTELGRMLGFDTEKPKTKGSPDSVWRLGSNFVLLFESKSNQAAEGGVSVRTCRQAQGHREWVEGRPFFTQNAEITTIVVCPREHLDKDAEPHADELYWAHLNEIRNLFQEAEACLRVIRSESLELEAEQRLQLILRHLINNRLTPRDIVTRLTRRKLIDLPRM